MNEAEKILEKLDSVGDSIIDVLDTFNDTIWDGDDFILEQLLGIKINRK